MHDVTLWSYRGLEERDELSKVQVDGDEDKAQHHNNHPVLRPVAPPAIEPINSDIIKFTIVND